MWRKFFMIPNIITTFRLFLVPLFAYLMLVYDSIFGACIVFVISGVSDVIDGIIARKCNMITDTGKVYDPLVDKLMQLTVIFAFAARDFIPLWVLIIIMAKELAMIAAGLVLYVKKIIVQARWFGKLSTVVFYAVILMLVVFKDASVQFTTALLSVLVATILFSALAYFAQFISNQRGKN
jgi:cardiolipin synthase